MTTCIAVRCPHCHTDQVAKRGTTACRTQRALCQHARCATSSVLLDSHTRGCIPAVQDRIVDMRCNASGVRDTARAFPISPTTVLRERTKKGPARESVNTALRRTVHPDEVTGDIARAGEAEMDDMWSFVGRTTHPRWLWHAMDPQTGTGLASGCGRRKDTGFLTRKALLEPFGLPHDSTDTWGAYTRHLDPEVHTGGPRYTQQIARKHFTLRTRSTRGTRTTICCSTSTQMPDMVIGVFVNRSACGRAV